MSIEWELDPTIGDQISKIEKEAVENRFILMDQTLRNRRIVNSYVSENDVILNTYRKENKHANIRETIGLARLIK